MAAKMNTTKKISYASGGQGKKTMPSTGSPASGGKTAAQVNTGGKGGANKGQAGGYGTARGLQKRGGKC